MVELKAAGRATERWSALAEGLSAAARLEPDRRAAAACLRDAAEAFRMNEGGWTAQAENIQAHVAQP